MIMINIKLNIAKIHSFLLLLFFLILPISIYKGFEIELTILFYFISIFSFRFKGYTNHLLKNNLILIWEFYIIIQVISTFIFRGLSGWNTVFYSVLFFLIVFNFQSNWNQEFFLKSFRNIFLILGMISILGRNYFDILKIGTQYLNSGNIGIDSLFEYRHYYGVYLIAYMLINLVYPFKNKILNIASWMILVLNLIMLETVNSWLAVTVVLIIYMAKNHRASYKQLIIGFITIMLFCVFLLVFYRQISDIFIKNFNRIGLIISNGFLTNQYSSVRSYTIQNGSRYILSNWKKYIWIGGGNGFALEWLRNNPYNPLGWESWTKAIDNQYITTFMDSGLLGLGAICALFFKSINQIKIQTNSKFMIFPLSLFSMFFVMAFFDLFGQGTIFLFWNICLIATANQICKYNNIDLINCINKFTMSGDKNEN